MIDKYELLNNYPTQEEVKEFNNLKSKKNNKRWSWVEKKTSQALLVIILTTGVTAAYQVANPQVVEASSVEREQEKEREDLAYLEKKFKDATYQEIYDLWIKGFNPLFENEQKIVDREVRTWWDKRDKNRALRRIKSLEKLKQMVGQVVIIKGYELEGKYKAEGENPGAKRDYARETLKKMERRYLGYVLYYWGVDVWNEMWNIIEKISIETGKVIDSAHDQID